jgi:N-acetyl-1-D-myo-inositol-2-amino-2-deoxy-alpha-D-glucopyranoside deacetylase/mycothiol S-conjugate amidase
MTNQRTLIFVGAHPDDETFGLGGTLAKYALEGAKVVYACATRGEVGAADPEHMQGFATVADMRWTELTNAAKELGLAEVIHLGYRDSGMPGSPDNAHPEAQVAAPLEEVTARVVKVLRAVKPQVVITFDPIGGYRHPDHIATHTATVKAFHAAGDPVQFPDLGPAYQPQKLYYMVFPRGFLRLAVKLMPLFGVNPRKFGRNKDVDVASLAEVDFPVHARIRIEGESARRKERATACHKSQLPSGPPSRGMMGWIIRTMGGREMYMRAYPEVKAGEVVKETDLFEGVKLV